MTSTCIVFSMAIALLGGCNRTNKQIDEYECPSSFLGYHLGDSVEFSTNNNDIIKVIEPPNTSNATNIDGIKGGIYDLRCKEDFGGIFFEQCRAIVSINGIKIISAQTRGITKKEYDLAVKRMTRLLNNPTTKKDGFTSWKFGEYVRINFILDNDVATLIYGMF